MMTDSFLGRDPGVSGAYIDAFYAADIVHKHLRPHLRIYGGTHDLFNMSCYEIARMISGASGQYDEGGE